MTSAHDEHCKIRANTSPEDAMQIDFDPKLTPSGGYENIVTAMDVFSRYLFAYPISSQDAKTIAKAIFSIMTKNAYLPTTIISDNGSVFMSQVIKKRLKFSDLPYNMPQHSIYKQSIGMLERTHASLEETLKIQTGERRSMWHKYVNIAALS